MPEHWTKSRLEHRFLIVSEITILFGVIDVYDRRLTKAQVSKIMINPYRFRGAAAVEG